MNAQAAYERIVRPILFSLSPEAAHNLAIGNLRAISSWPSVLRQLERFQPAPKPKTVFGLSFPNPVGLAAGFDKNGVAIPAWAALGFGFVEIGTVTAKAQPGNPKPRIFRYPAQEALINRLGFNNDGADVVAARLRMLRESGHWPAIPVGINIGKSKITPIENAVDDYLYSFRLLAPLADYLVINVSSPNTVGLRSLQTRDALRRLLFAVMNMNGSNAYPKPIFVKIAPDLSEVELREIVLSVEEHEVTGIVATNTSNDDATRRGTEPGGVSGRPLQARSTKVIRSIRTSSRLGIIGVGGIVDADSACEKLHAGADLLQLYTGYVYRGPTLLREIIDSLPS